MDHSKTTLGKYSLLILLLDYYNEATGTLWLNLTKRFVVTSTLIRGQRWSLDYRFGYRCL